MRRITGQFIYKFKQQDGKPFGVSEFKYSVGKFKFSSDELSFYAIGTIES